MIEDIKNIESRGEYRAVFFLFPKMKIMGHVYVKIQLPRPMQRIARGQPAIRTVVEDAVAVRIESGGHVDGLAGIRLQGNAQSEQAGGLESPDKSTFVQPVYV